MFLRLTTLTLLAFRTYDELIYCTGAGSLRFWKTLYTLYIYVYVCPYITLHNLPAFLQLVQLDSYYTTAATPTVSTSPAEWRTIFAEPPASLLFRVQGELGKGICGSFPK